MEAVGKAVSTCPVPSATGRVCAAVERAAATATCVRACELKSLCVCAVQEIAE